MKWKEKAMEDESDGYTNCNGKTTKPYNNEQKNNRTRKILDYAVPVDHRIKLNENEKKDMYQNLTSEVKRKSYGRWKWRLYQL